MPVDRRTCEREIDAKSNSLRERHKRRLPSAHSAARAAPARPTSALRTGLEVIRLASISPARQAMLNGLERVGRLAARDSATASSRRRATEVVGRRAGSEGVSVDWYWRHD